MIQVRMGHTPKIPRKGRTSDLAPKLRAGMRAEDAAQVILRAHVAEFGDQLSLLRRPDTPEAVHQSRVVLRRLRAALQAFAPLIDPDLRRALTRDLRALFRKLGKVRDAEVLAAQPGRKKQRVRLMAKAAKRRAALSKSLKSRRVRRFSKAMDAAFSGKSWRCKASAARPLRKAPVEALACLALERAWARSLQAAADLSACSPGERHELRKKLKGFRYMAEDFAPLWPLEPPRPFLTLLRELQEDLGLLNDLALAQVHGLTPDPGEAAAAIAHAASRWSSLQTALPWWRSQPVTGP